MPSVNRDNVAAGSSPNLRAEVGANSECGLVCPWCPPWLLVQERVACTRRCQRLALPFVPRIGAGVGGSANGAAQLVGAVVDGLWLANFMQRSWCPSVRSPSLPGHLRSGVVTMGGRPNSKTSHHQPHVVSVACLCSFVSPTVLPLLCPHLQAKARSIGPSGARGWCDLATAMPSKGASGSFRLSCRRCQSCRARASISSRLGLPHWASANHSSPCEGENAMPWCYVESRLAPAFAQSAARFGSNGAYRRVVSPQVPFVLVAVASIALALPCAVVRTCTGGGRPTVLQG